MENNEKNQGIAYKKAQQRVSEIRAFVYMVLGFFLIVGVFMYSDYEKGQLFAPNNYKLWMFSTWAIFIIGYGIFVFVPYFRHWEERKIKKLMNKNNHGNIK